MALKEAVIQPAAARAELMALNARRVRRAMD
jgi:hypothetical protein